MPPPDLTVAEVLRESWRRGDIDYLRHDAQRLLTGAVRKATTRTTVLHAARGFGKTFDALVDHIEFATANRDTCSMFAAINRDETKRSFTPSCRWCSKHARPRCARNGSRRSTRTSSATARCCTLKESTAKATAAITCAARIFTSSQATRSASGAIRSTSTSPSFCRSFNASAARAGYSRPRLRALATASLRCVRRAIRKGGYHKFTVHDNPRLTPAQIQADAEEVSGLEGEAVWKSTAVRREFLCEFVTDAERAVVPEFNDALHVGEQERPEYVDCYLGTRFRPN